MITRENLTDIIKLGMDDNTEFFANRENHEYVHISASFFNVGASVTLTLMDDLPGDWSELSEGGNDVFLETSDPVFDDIVKIEITEASNMVIVTLNGICYAVFQECSLDDIDQARVIHWVKETCYEGCYLSDAYIAPSMRPEEFGHQDGPHDNPTQQDIMREG